MSSMVLIAMPAADHLSMSVSRRSAPTDPEGRTRTFTLRAQQFAGPDLPRPGDYLLSRSTETAWRILGVTKLLRAGDKPGTHKLRLTCRTVIQADLPIPDSAAVHPWPEPQAKAPVPPPLSLPRKAVEPARVKDRGRLEMAERMSRWHDGDPLVPSIRLETIKEGNRKLRGPTATQSRWRDPDDLNPRNRKPREVSGLRTFDQVRTLSKRNPAIKQEHVVAADMYRLAWELGPGQARPGYERPMMPVQGFGPAGGPDDTRLAHMAAWGRLQAYLGDVRMIRALDLVILAHGGLTEAAKLIGLGRREVVGYLVLALDRLLAYYAEEVSETLRQDDLGQA